MSGSRAFPRSALRCIRTNRPALTQPRSLYHSYERSVPPPYDEPEATILAAALRHVPAYGFSSEALVLGTKDAQYLDISMNLFPRGSFDLLQYHLITQRLSLKDRVQFLDKSMGTGRRVRSLILERLRGNIENKVVDRWQEALGLMSLAENIPSSTKELSLLADEILFLAGETSVDTSWYTRRLSLAAIYAATEVYQTTDQSSGFRDTELFLDRRLDELCTVGSFIGSATQWAGFQAGAVINLLRSKGVRI